MEKPDVKDTRGVIEKKEQTRTFIRYNDKIIIIFWLILKIIFFDLSINTKDKQIVKIKNSITAGPATNARGKSIKEKKIIFWYILFFVRSNLKFLIKFIFFNLNYYLKIKKYEKN
mgnify:CR=1 FL=1